MTVNTSLFAKGLVTQDQFGALVTDYDLNIEIVADSLDELSRRVGVLEAILQNMVDAEHE